MSKEFWAHITYLDVSQKVMTKQADSMETQSTLLRAIDTTIKENANTNKRNAETLDKINSKL